jgi:Protein of unknown function (DUF3108)
MKIFTLLKLLLIVFFPICLFSQNTFTNLGFIKEKKIMPFRLYGENLKFKITYLGFTGGYAQMITDVPNKKTEYNQDTIKFTLKASTTPFVSAIYKLVMENVSICNANTLNSLYYKEFKIENKTTYDNSITFNAKEKNYQLNYTRNNKKKISFHPFPNPGYDIISSFYLARCIKLIPGTEYYAYVYFKNKRYRITIQILGRKKIKTAFGKIDTIIIIPRMDFKGVFLNKGDIIIYLSDDKYRIPLLMESKLTVGSFKAKLISGYPKND